MARIIKTEEDMEREKLKERALAFALWDMGGFIRNSLLEELKEQYNSSIIDLLTKEKNMTSFYKVKAADDMVKKDYSTSRLNPDTEEERALLAEYIQWSYRQIIKLYKARQKQKKVSSQTGFIDRRISSEVSILHEDVMRRILGDGQKALTASEILKLPLYKGAKESYITFIEYEFNSIIEGSYAYKLIFHKKYPEYSGSTETLGKEIESMFLPNRTIEN